MSAFGWIGKAISKLRAMEGLLIDFSSTPSFRHCSAEERKIRLHSTFNSLGRLKPSFFFFFFFDSLLFFFFYHSPWVRDGSDRRDVWGNIVWER